MNEGKLYLIAHKLQFMRLPIEKYIEDHEQLGIVCAIRRRINTRKIYLFILYLLKEYVFRYTRTYCIRGGKE